jgi:hypothetical protein
MDILKKRAKTCTYSPFLKCHSSVEFGKSGIAMTNQEQVAENCHFLIVPYWFGFSCHMSLSHDVVPYAIALRGPYVSLMKPLTP